MGERQSFSKEFKLEAVRLLDSGSPRSNWRLRSVGTSVQRGAQMEFSIAFSIIN